MRFFKPAVFMMMGLLLIAASGKPNSDGALLTPLIDVSANPKGLAVPASFLGLHLNRWSDDTTLGLGDLPMPGVVSIVGGVAYFTSATGYTFYYYRNEAKVKLVGMGTGGADFNTTITLLESPTGKYPTVAKLATVPYKTGSGTIKYPFYLPTFGYGAVRSHSSGVNWATLHTADGQFNSRLMSAWVRRHAGKKLMFTMTGTPEWLASSNIAPVTRSVSDNVATIYHAALPFAIPVGSKIKVRNCPNIVLNGEWVILSSSTTSTSFSVITANESTVNDSATELLLWGNDGGYGYMNPPKDFSKVNAFVIWLMRNYGDRITWIEGPNEANSGHTVDGKVAYFQGQGLWWTGTFDQLGEMMRRINVTAKAINPAVLIGAPSITGLHNGQPINPSPSNRANGYQLLSAGDGAKGKLVDWIDFVPFHTYDIGAAWPEHRTVYDMLIYLREMLQNPAINKPNIPIYMNEGGFEHYGNYRSSAKIYFDSLSTKQQANEIFKMAAINAGFGVKGFYPFASGFLGDYETTPEIAAVYNKINTRVAGKTIHPNAAFNKVTGAMYFKTTDGYEEYIP
jgi:hypothetical protein